LGTRVLISESWYYAKEDFAEMAKAHSLSYTRAVKAFVSKVMVLDKPF